MIDKEIVIAYKMNQEDIYPLNRTNVFLFHSLIPKHLIYLQEDKIIFGKKKKYIVNLKEIKQIELKFFNLSPCGKIKIFTKTGKKYTVKRIRELFFVLKRLFLRFDELVLEYPKILYRGVVIKYLATLGATLRMTSEYPK
ncbi:MAG: hypothetical protein FWE13_04615 [Firmicutes bacterium]|nr:hypothetical protein [Bacillota bacterium]